MFILRPAPSERADACFSRRISLSGLPPDEAEKICLLAEILGWQAHEHAETAATDAPGEGVRLVLRLAGSVIRVDVIDPDVRRQLARQGLDRLVPPVPVLALEQLFAFAG